MTKPDARASQTTTLAIFAAFVLTVLSSLRARGLRQTLLFLALGIGLPVGAEYYSINQTRVLRHHLQPQIENVPVPIALAWYIIGHNTFTVIESLLRRTGAGPRSDLLVLPVLTAVTATSMDLVTDVAMLEQGYWEWRDGGPYAAEVAGPNGRHGIPLENYSGWLALTSLVTGLFMLLRGRAPDPAIHDAGRAAAGRRAALLLLPSYASAVAWEIGRGRKRYILASALFPLVLITALVARKDN